MPTTPSTQALRVVGPNLPSAALATFHVHAAGCRDLDRGWIKNCRDGWTAEYDSLLAIEADVYDFAPAENEGYTLGDYQTEFHYAPCVHLPMSAPTADAEA